ncbi:MAG: hypothetical protein OCU20_09960 [Methanophagales archaeon]|nr:hypothetical protein [Methanophagales archaeon]MCW3140525.1 hypothetical protein [Methanophagales archaeon]MCW7069527.1 hypothetical protein [Methanophagales archaeon]MCW7074168.1 hypothetical protein [Methanophagales archaeon]
MTLFLFFMRGCFAPHEKMTFDIDYLYRKAGRGLYGSAGIRQRHR